MPIYYHNQLSWTGRIRAFLRFVWASYQTAAQIPGIDLVVATSTPLSIGLPALALKKRKGWPYIFEVRDLWPDAPIQMGYLSKPLLPLLSRYLEKIIYQNAEGLLALSPPMVQALEKRAPKKRIRMVPNMSDCSMPPLAPTSKTILKVAYFGTLGPANGLESLVRIAHTAQNQDEKRLHFLIIGEGKEEEYLKGLAQSWKLHNLEFHPAHNREDLRKLLEGVSVAYISYASYPILETGSPNKFFDALAWGLACFLNFQGWIWEEVNDQACGVYAPPESPQKGLEVLQMYLENPSLLQKHQENARKLAETQFNSQALSRQWVRFLEEIGHNAG